MLLQTYIQQSRAKEENLQKLLTRLCAYRWIFLYSQRFRFSCVCWKVNERGKERLHHIYKHGVTTSHHTTPYRTAPHRTAPYPTSSRTKAKAESRVRSYYVFKQESKERERGKKKVKEKRHNDYKIPQTHLLLCVAWARPGQANSAAIIIINSLHINNTNMTAHETHENERDAELWYPIGVRVKQRLKRTINRTTYQRTEPNLKTILYYVFF